MRVENEKMNIINIKLSDLSISKHNVRKNNIDFLEDEETNIESLS